MEFTDQTLLFLIRCVLRPFHPLDVYTSHDPPSYYWSSTVSPSELRDGFQKLICHCISLDKILFNIMVSYIVTIPTSICPLPPSFPSPVSLVHPTPLISDWTYCHHLSLSFLTYFLRNSSVWVLFSLFLFQFYRKVKIDPWWLR